MVCFVLIYHHRQVLELTLKSKDKFYNRSPDLITVFTGGKGRIKRVLDLSLQHSTSKILITGVYSKNTLEVLLRAHDTKNKTEDEIFQYYSRIIDLDYKAKNTYENIEQTIQIIKKDKSIKKILVVSSDYHLPRINYLFNKIMDNKEVEVFYEPVFTKSYYQYIYQISLETLKFIKAFFS